MKNLKFIHITIILGIVIGVLLLLYGGQILTNDNYSPELNPSLTISRSLFEPAYRAYRSLGIASDSEQADIWRSVVMLPFRTLGLQGIAALLYMISMFILGGVSTFLLSKSIFKQGKSVLLLSFVATIVYLTTLWSAWVFNFPVMPFVTFYGTFPLVLWAFTRFIRDFSYKNALIFLVVSFIFTASSVISTLFFVMLSALGLWSLYLVVNSKFKLKAVRNVFLAIILFILTQIFWLLPFSHYYLNNAGQIQNSSVNNAITYNTIDAEAAKMTLANSTTLYTTHLDLYEAASAESKMFVEADKYNTSDIMRVISFIPIAASIWGLLLIFYKKDYRLLPLWLLLSVSLFMLNNLNPPFGWLYQILQEKIPIFEQVFRWPTSKFGNVFLLALALTSAYGFVSLLTFIGGLFKLPKVIKYSFAAVSILGFTSLMLFYSGYIWNGNLIADRSYVEMPDDYQQLSDYLKQEGLTERMIILPLPNNGYFREYKWGFYGSGFLHYMIENPLVEKSLSVGSLYSEKAINDIEKAYYSGDKQMFDALLTKYNIEYLLVDKSLIKGRYGFDIDWDLVGKMAGDSEVIWEYNDVSVLEVSRDNVDSQLVAIDDSNFYTQEQNSYQYLNSIASTSTWEVDESYIKIDVDNEVKLASPLNYSKYPVSVEMVDKSLVITPVFPTIQKQTIVLPARQYNLSETDTLLDIGGYVVDTTKISDQLFLDIPFSTINAIKTLKSNEISLLRDLSKAEVGICDGDEEDLETRGMIASSMINNQLVIDVTRGLGCLSIPIEGNVSFLDVKIEFEAQQGDIVGFCLYSYKRQECLNSETFFYTYESGFPQIIGSDIANRIDDGDEISFNFYINAKKSTQVKVSDIQLTSYTSERWLPNNDLSEVSKVLGEDNKLVIPILQSKYTYQLDRTNPIMWNYSTDRDSLLETSEIQDIGIQTIVDHDYSYLFKDLLTVRPSDDFIYAISSENFEGFPAHLCILGDLFDKCLVDSYFEKGARHTGGGTFSNDINSTKFIASLRNSSSSTISVNSLKNLVIMEYPEVWKELNTFTEISDMKLIEMKKQKFGSVYTFVIDSPTLLVIDEAKESGWKLYKVDSYNENLPSFIYNLFVPLTKDSVDEDVLLNDWQQGWQVAEAGTYVAVYTPNILGYIGYLVLFVLSTVIGVGYLIDKKRNYAKS